MVWGPHVPSAAREELLIAGTAAYARGAHALAVTTVAPLLLDDPQDPRARPLLRACATEDAPPWDPASLFCACLVRSEQPEDLRWAFSNLLILLADHPLLPHAPLAAKWAAGVDDDVFVARCVNRYLATQIRRFPNIFRHYETERAVLRLAEPILQLVEERLDDEGSLALASSVARKYGDFRRAFALAERLEKRQPGYDAYISLANAHRASGRPELALPYYEKILAHQPDDPQIHRDRVYALLEASRFGEAQARIEAAPDHLGLGWGLHIARAQQGRETPPFLQDLLRHYPDLTSDEMWTCTEAEGGWLPSPTDAIIRLLPSEGESAVLHTVSTDFEVPSAWATFQAIVEIPSCSVLGTADRRQLEPRPGGLRLWHCRTETAEDGTYSVYPVEPAVPPPPQELARVIAEMARTPYLRTRWWTRARTLANAERPDPMALVQCMVHVDLRGSTRPADHRFAVQVAAAFVLAHCPGGVGLLIEVVRGIPDWSVRAALVALTEAALHEPEHLLKVQAVFWELASQPSSALRSYAPTMERCAERLPGWSTVQRSALAMLKEPGGDDD